MQALHALTLDDPKRFFVIVLHWGRVLRGSPSASPMQSSLLESSDSLEEKGCFAASARGFLAFGGMLCMVDTGFGRQDASINAALQRISHLLPQCCVIF